MQQLLAIVAVTVKAAFRYRLVAAVSILLLATVVILPVIVKDDGTARGFTQIILTYTLSIITALLGFVTLWLACGTLAQDVEDCSMQMVAVKPIPRWKVWIGKWLGIMALNAALMAVSGIAVFALLNWRAQWLSPEERHILENEVMVARASARPPIPEIEQGVQAELAATIENNPMSDLDKEVLETQIRANALMGHQYVPPGYLRNWEVDLGVVKHFLKDRPLYLRFKFQTPPDYYERTVGDPPTYPGGFDVGPPSEGARQRWTGQWTSKTFHEQELDPNLFDEEGKLLVQYVNMGELSLLFPVEDGIEILYRESGFGINFARGLGIILCWLGLLSALGLAAASFLSFPVAAFLSLCALLVSFSGDTMARVLEDGTLWGVNHETGESKTTILDYLVIPFFHAAVAVVNRISEYSPIDLLSSGRSITWLDFGAAFFWIVIVAGGALAAIGIAAFQRRELASAQGSN